MDKLFEFYRRRIDETDTSFVRYKYNSINWNGKMLGVVGPRGVGKTTMVLQHIKNHLDIEESLYISADQLYFSHHSLIEIADKFNKIGGKHLFIDEVHRYQGWSSELKEIYDSYRDLQVVFTGSSILDIYKGASDLSRRAPIYAMQGLSFREYLHMFHQIETPVLTYSQVLANQIQVQGVAHPLPLFRQYLQNGYYPFGREEDFQMKLMQVVVQTMETDIPQFAKMNTSVGARLKKLLMVIAQSVPFKPQMSTLSQVTGISRNDMSDYLYYIERAGLIAQLRDSTIGVRGIGKLEKIYLDNPNLFYVLAESRPNIGSVRETFFLNQMRVNFNVKASKIADFDIDGKTFEVGGARKGKKQIADAEEGYVLKDDIEYGYSNVIPLWAFGLLY